MATGVHSPPGVCVHCRHPFPVLWVGKVRTRIPQLGREEAGLALGLAAGEKLPGLHC